MLWPVLADKLCDLAQRIPVVAAAVEQGLGSVDLRQFLLPRRLPVRVPDRQLLGHGTVLPPELAPRRRVPHREPHRACVNLSYETVDLRLSYELTEWLRVPTVAPGTSSPTATPTTCSPGRPRWASRPGPGAPLRRDPPADRGRRCPVPRAERLERRHISEGRRPAREGVGLRPEDPVPGGVLQRILAERTVLPGQGRVHRGGRPPLPVLTRSLQAVQRQAAAGEELAQPAAHVRRPMGEVPERFIVSRRRSSRQDSCPSRTNPDRMSAWQSAFAGSGAPARRSR